MKRNMPPKLWIKTGILQVSSGAVSFICSSSLAYMIKTNNKGLKNPYRRLIFAISVSDMMQSLRIALGPFLNDSAVPHAFWAIGNKHTCRLDGLLFALGSTGAPMYSCALCIYYYCKLYKKMPNQRFAQKVEIWINQFVLIFLTTTNIYALGTKSFNSSQEGQFCLYAVTPSGCRQRPDLYGECESTPDPNSIAILSLLTSVFIPVACLVISVVLLSFLLWKTLLNERIFGLSSTSSCNENVNNMQNEEEEKKSTAKEIITADVVDSEEIASPLAGNSRKNAERQSTVKQYRGVKRFVKKRRLRTSGSNIEDDSTGTASRAYRQEMTVQLILYCCSFLLSHLLLAIVQIMLLIMKSTPSLPLTYATKALFPLQGLFNVVIFLRPAVRVTKMRRPETSWIKAYYLVVKNGGESLQERQPVLSPIDYPSVQYGVENFVHPMIPRSENVEDVSKECRYVDSSSFNSCQDWDYVKGDQSEIVVNDDIDNVLVGIHHNDLDAIVEAQDDDEEEDRDEVW